MPGALNRRTFLVAAIAVTVAPAAAAADSKPTYRCTARLWRTGDGKEARLVTVTCPAGRKVEGIDGDRDFSTNPPRVQGLRAAFVVTPDGDKLNLHCEATFRDTYAHVHPGDGDSGKTETHGELFIETASSVDAALTSGQSYDQPLDVNGVPFTLTLTVQAL